MTAATSAILALVAAWATAIAMASLSVDEEAKVSPDLLRAIRCELDSRVDVLVQLASPSQQNSCDHPDSTILNRAQRAYCVAESLQTFAERTQQPVKDLLDQHSKFYGSCTFLWISNSVAVKDARWELVVALARLDAVEKIDMEQVFQIQADV